MQIVTETSDNYIQREDRKKSVIFCSLQLSRLDFYDSVTVQIYDTYERLLWLLF